uniref:DUF3084 domain-containing protein n=1 Tax=Deinococcus planocerae TaxID=1737569 RepID=UPI0011AF2415
MLWLFLPFVVILSGVVAYAADTIAKKVGRKHLRWFGLRPKSTALLVAVLSGMGISAASLAAFLLLNRNAVNTIAQADQLRPQVTALREELQDVQGGAGGETRERGAGGSRGRLAASEEALTSSRERARALDARVEALGRQVADLDARAAQAETAATQAQARAQTAQERVGVLGGQVADLEASRQRVETQRNQLAGERDAARQARDAAVAASAQAEAQRVAAQEERDRLAAERTG